MPRAFTLQDIFKGLQGQLDALQNPLPSGPVLLDTTVVADEGFNTADANAVVARSSLGVWAPDPLTLSGNEITDALRKLGVQGDGRSADSSFGVWEASTNLFTNGGVETNLNGWVLGAGSTFTRVAGGKFGSWCGRLTQGGAAGSVNVQARNVDGSFIAAAAGSAYSWSFWAKTPAGRVRAYIEWYSAGAYLSASDGGYVNADTGPFTRLTVSATAPVGTTRALLYVQHENLAAGSTMDVEGAQFEQKAFATPYIHTDGATATRAAGRVQAPGSLLNANTGWLAIRVRPGWNGATPPALVPPLFDFSQGASYIQAYYTAFSWRLYRSDGATTQATTKAATPVAGTPATIVCTWTPTSLSISVDGSVFSTVTFAAQAPTIAASLFDIGTISGGYNIDGDVLWSASGTGALTDANAATLNALGNTIPDWGTLPPSAAPTMIWPAVDATTKGSGWGTTIFS